MEEGLEVIDIDDEEDQSQQMVSWLKQHYPTFSGNQSNY